MTLGWGWWWCEVSRLRKGRSVGVLGGEDGVRRQVGKVQVEPQAGAC